MKKEYQDRIDEYLMNRMSAEDRLIFMKEVDSDHELQEQLTFTKNVQQVLKSRNEKLAKMEQWEKSEQVAAVKPRNKQRRNLYWISGIAAVLIAGFFLNHYRMTEDEHSAIYSETENMAVRGGSSYPDIRLLLKQKNHEEALSLIQETLSSIREDSVRFCQDTSLSVDEKERKIQLVKGQQEEINWLKVSALLGLQRKDEALALLNEMRKGKGLYQMSADSLYRQIKNLP